MRFDELATRAGRNAADVGRRADRPSFSVIRRERHRRNLFAGLSAAVAVVVLGFGTFLLWPEPGVVSPVAASQTTTTVADSTNARAREACAVTEPGGAPFTPVSENPDGPPDLYDAVWYGTPELWTMVNIEGQVWPGLPVGEDGSLTQKTFWWAEGYVFDEEPSPDITVTLESLDGSAPTVQAGGPGTNGTHPDLGSFMLVGLEIPQAGCWRVTAEYRGASLSYVVWVGDDAASG